MRRLEICGVVRMTIKERISQTKKKLEKLKGPPAEADPYLVGTGQSGKGL